MSDPRTPSVDSVPDTAGPPPVDSVVVATGPVPAATAPPAVMTKSAKKRAKAKRAKVRRAQPAKDGNAADPADNHLPGVIEIDDDDDDLPELLDIDDNDSDDDSDDDDDDDAGGERAAGQRAAGQRAAGQRTAVEPATAGQRTAVEPAAAARTAVEPAAGEHAGDVEDIASYFDYCICSPFKKNVLLCNVPFPLMKRVQCTACGAATPHGIELRLVGEYWIFRCVAEGVEFAVWNRAKRTFTAWPARKGLAAVDVVPPPPPPPRTLTLHVLDLNNKTTSVNIIVRSKTFSYNDLPGELKHKIATGSRKGIDLLLPNGVPGEPRFRQVLPLTPGVYIGSPKELDLRISHGYYPPPRRIAGRAPTPGNPGHRAAASGGVAHVANAVSNGAAAAGNAANPIVIEDSDGEPLTAGKRKRKQTEDVKPRKKANTDKTA